MPFQVFLVPVRDSDRGCDELNKFLRSHRILAVDRRWVDVGAESLWAFCVDYLDGQAGGSGAPRGSASRGKVDYKELLSPDDFAVFARLRDWRKQVAQVEAVPVYTVFTNEQLAKMVQSRADSKAGLEEIAGIGDARVEKYGPRVLDLLASVWTETGRRSAAAAPGSEHPLSAGR